MMAPHPMIPKASITKTSQLSPGWPVMFGRTETFRQMAYLVTKQNRLPMQGCFPMTD